MENQLRRYTDIPAAVHMLKQKALTFLDPRSWDDKNDSYYLRKYRVKRDVAAVLAICFTRTDETYHHWRVFAHGASGMCVRFNRERLVEAVRRNVRKINSNIRFRSR